MLRLAQRADVTCFGSLAQRAPVSRASIRAFVAATPRASLRIFDINLRQNYFSQEIIEQSLRLANVLKLNDDELPVLAAIARAKDVAVNDLTVVVLDRPRHLELIDKVRATGARIILIGDGDVAGAIATSWHDSGVDVLMGIGGTPEGVISAAALKCMGGAIQGKLWARDDTERASAIVTGWASAADFAFFECAPRFPRMRT